MKALRIGQMIFICVLLLQFCAPKKTKYSASSLSLNEKEKAGETVFMEHCERCHPQGQTGLGPSILPVAPNFAKRFQVRHGVGAMPSFDEKLISEQQLDELSAYLKKLK